MANFDVGDVILGKYDVTRVLGQGGMGVVVAARHRTVGELVAIKFLQPHIRQNEESRTRFEREARLAFRIKSAHVVRILDIASEDGTSFIVMEYLSGRDLAAELRERGRFPVEKAVDLLLQACEAIAEAHTLGFLHRDLKPANLFLTTGSDGMPFVKVLDFGIAKSLSTNEDASVTSSQATVGSPLYMSPEQLTASKNIDLRSDVWSLGVILYEMLTGSTPFVGDSLGTVAAAVMRGLFPRISAEHPEVPAELDDVLVDTLTRERDRRVPSVAAFAARIAPFGSSAARESLARIERIASRVGEASSEPADATIVDEAPSAAQGLQPARGTVPGTAISNPVALSQRHPIRGRRVAVVAAFGLVVAASVAALVGLRSPHPPPPAPVCTDALQKSKGDLCHECDYTSCCSEFAACRASSECETYLDCRKGCDNHAHDCRDACIRKFPQGHAIAVPYLACHSITCFGPCTPPGHDATCTGCRWTNCQPAATACLNDPGCDALTACAVAVGGPSNSAGMQKCRKEQSSVAQKEFAELETCSMMYCSNNCGVPAR